MKTIQPARLKMKGIINIKHYRDGALIEEETVTNTVTNDGLAQVAGLINEVTSGGYKWLAVGDSSTAAAAGDTSLASELTDPSDLDRASATTSRQTTNVSDDTARLVHTFTNNSSSTIGVKEAGLFNTSTESSGSPLGRQTFAVKNMENQDTLQITYDITVS